MSKNLVFAIGDGKTIKTEIEDVDIYTLKYYPENPRIGSMLLNMSKKVTEELIYDLMWTKHGESVRELYQNIKTAGNVNEPLIVYNNKVLEGNTRLSVLRKLYKETKDLNWKTVKCRVIKDTLAPKDIDYLMCRINLADKKKDWEPFEQACYFYKLVKENGHSMKYIKEDDFLDTMAEGYSRIYLNIGVDQMAEQVIAMAEKYDVDGIVMHSNRSCKPYSFGQMDIMRIVREKTGIPVLMIEADMTDPRSFSQSQVETRIDAFMEIIKQKEKRI